LRFFDLRFAFSRALVLAFFDPSYGHGLSSLPGGEG
jgi:hypothetical protein